MLPTAGAPAEDGDVVPTRAKQDTDPAELLLAHIESACDREEAETVGDSIFRESLEARQMRRWRTTSKILARRVVEAEAAVDRKTVERLSTQMAVVRWVGLTIASIALASAITLARMLFGWGRDDAELRARVSRATELVEECRATNKEQNATIEEMRREWAGRLGRRDRPNPPAPALVNDPGGDP